MDHFGRRAAVVAGAVVGEAEGGAITGYATAGLIAAVATGFSMLLVGRLRMAQESAATAASRVGMVLPEVQPKKESWR